LTSLFHFFLLLSLSTWAAAAAVAQLAEEPAHDTEAEDLNTGKIYHSVLWQNQQYCQNEY